MIWRRKMDRRKIFELFDEYKNYTDERVKNGIEKNRKGDAFIKVTDKDGNPLKNVKIEVKQLNHEFKYGANIFMLDELETEEKNEKYKEYFKKAFNMATLPFYWNDLEPKQGQTRYEKNSKKIYRRPAPDLCIDFCQQNGIEPREHALAYEHFFPEWLAAADITKVKKAYEKRCAEIAERYADKIKTIEVTNETFWDNGITALYDEPDFIEYCFKTARKHFPHNQLVINEWPCVWDCPGRGTDQYYAQIERALLKGAEIDAIGLQYHMFFKAEEEYKLTRKAYNPRHLYKMMDNYARLGKALQITEITIPCYTDSAEDEEIQAEIIKKLYPIWFSHESVDQIIYWNVVDGYAAFAKQGDMSAGENYYRGGLIRFDLTPKPAYYAIVDMFEKKWRTNTQVNTNENGSAYFRGFYGEYEITISDEKQTVERRIKLKKNGTNEFILEV